MQIRYGHTRLALIFEHRVIKIARIHPIGPLMNLFMYPYRQELPNKLKRLRENPRHEVKKSLLRIFWIGDMTGKARKLRSVLAALFCPGIFANRREHEFYMKHKDSTEELLPVYESLFLGFVLIQQRGEVLREEDPLAREFRMMLEQKGFAKDTDLYPAKNMCTWRGNLRVLDYGNENTVVALENGGFALLRSFNGLAKA